MAFNLNPPLSMDGQPTQKQLMYMYSYLYQVSEQLNVALNQLTIDNFSAETKQTIGADGVSDTTKQEIDASYNNLKTMIIKTADTVRSEMDVIRTTLESSYMAKSDFGTYTENMALVIEEMASGITENYSFISTVEANANAIGNDLETYKTETNAYIRRGIVYYEGTTPIYGIAIGQDLVTSEVEGETVIEQRNFRSVFTAQKLSFYQDSVEVAYVSNNKLYIPNAEITGKLTMGNFTIDTVNGYTIKWVGGA